MSATPPLHGPALIKAMKECERAGIVNIGGETGTGRAVAEYGRGQS